MSEDATNEESATAQTPLDERFALRGDGGEETESCLLCAGVDRSTGEDVSVRLLPAETPELATFASDARSLAAARHPNVVEVLGTTELPDGRLAIVTPLMDGATLRDVLAAFGHFSPERTVATLHPVADAVDWARGLGITHRRVTTESIHFDEGSARVLVWFEPASADAPAERTGAAADVRSLASLAWALLAGRELTADEQRNPPALASQQPGLPVSVTTYVDRALHGGAAGASSGSAFVDRLAEHAGVAPVIAAPEPVTEVRPAEAWQGTPTREYSVDTPVRTAVLPAMERGDRRPALQRILVGTALTVAVLATAFALGRDRGDGERGDSATVATASSGARSDSLGGEAALASSARTAPGRAACASATPADQRACLAASVAPSEIAVGAAYEALLAELRGRTATGAEIAGLPREQQRWREARDAECRRLGRAREGPLWAESRAACLNERSAVRARELTERLEALRRIP